MFEWKTPEVEETNRGKKAAGLGAAVVRIRRGMRRSGPLTAALMRPGKSACKQGRPGRHPRLGSSCRQRPKYQAGLVPLCVHIVLGFPMCLKSKRMRQVNS